MATKRKTAAKKQNKTTRLVYERFKQRFPHVPAQIDRVVYEYIPGSIRVRVIDPIFRGKTYLQREHLIDDVIQSFPEEIQRSLDLLLLLTPEEAKDKSDLNNLEFDDPNGERL